MLVLKVIVGVLFQAFFFGILLLPIAGGYWFEASNQYPPAIGNKRIPKKNA